MAPQDKVASADEPVSQSSKKPEDTDLSEEDAEKKAEIELLVERVQDTDLEIQKKALEMIKSELREATGTMTTVPRPLKFIKPHYETLKTAFAAMAVGENKVAMADIMALLAMSFSKDEEARESLQFKLQGTVSGLHDWGHQFVRTLAGELWKEWQHRLSQDDPLPVDDLEPMVQEAVAFHMEHHGEPEAVDLLMEIDRLPDILNHVNERAAPRVGRYLVACAEFLPEPEDNDVLKVAVNVYRNAGMWPDAMRVAAKMGDPEEAQKVFDDAPGGLIKQQLALSGASMNINLYTEDADLQDLLGNDKLSGWYAHLAKDLEVSEPKTVEDVTKADSSKNVIRNSHRNNLATTFTNAFLNVGHGSDKLLLVDEDSTRKWIHQHKDEGILSAAASLGVLHQWNPDEGLNALDTLLSANDDNVVAGALLGIGLCCSNTSSPVDAPKALLGRTIRDPNSSIKQKVCATMGLGMAFCASDRSDISDLLADVVGDEHSSAELFGMSALSIGAIHCGTANADAVEHIINGFHSREESALNNTMSRFAALGLGLIYMGRQDDCEVVREMVQALPDCVRDYALMTIDTCAYAGTGNVVHVQKLMHICAEKRGSDSDDDGEEGSTGEGAGNAKGAAKGPNPSSSRSSRTLDFSAAQKKDSDDAPATGKLDKAAEQAVAAIGLSLCVMGESVGSEMSWRLIEALLQYGDVVLKRAVPGAVALMYASNPEPKVLDMLSRLSHDTDQATAMSAVLGLGIVACGTNNSRCAQILRQQAQFFVKDASSSFVVRVAQGLLHAGRGLVTLSPQRSDRLVLSRRAIVGLTVMSHAAMDLNGTMLGSKHYILYWLAAALQPRMLFTLGEDLEPLQTTVRVGQAVDVTGQAGKPRTITGFQTHTTPVVLAWEQRAELATDEFITPASVLEGAVILQPNPDAEAEGADLNKSKA